MTRVIAWLRSVPLMLYGYAAVVALIVGGYSLFVAHERAIGAVKAQLAVADSTHAVALKVAEDSVRVFADAVAKAAKDRQAALTLVAKGKAQEAATAAAAQAAGSARDSATRVLADSLATVADLRTTLARLVDKTRADSVQAAAQHRVDTLSIRTLVAALASDSTAISRGIAAQNALTARAVAAENQARLTRKLLPSSIGGWLKTAAFVVVAIEAGRASAGKLP